MKLVYKLHTGRSRNEQIATDLRLYVREQIDAISQTLVELASEFVNAGEKLPANARCRLTRICNGPSRFWLRIGCSPMSRCSCAILSRWPIAASG